MGGHPSWGRGARQRLLHSCVLVMGDSDGFDVVGGTVAWEEGGNVGWDVVSANRVSLGVG